ncbi:3'-5' exonuclease [Candidatus Bathyarchaeota archaeon]|nr:3'-5' exonuclease [Candidatus Bathyarchaeota archaeon]
MTHLKHIPCPAGDTCTAFQCLFQHREDLEVEKAPSEQLHGPARAQDNTQISRKRKDDDGASDIEAPRKRIKAAENGEASSESRVEAPLPTTPQRDAPKGVPTAEPATLKRSVSPPLVIGKTASQGASTSVRRAQPSPLPNTPQNKAIASLGRHVASSPSSVASDWTPPPKKVVKSETLNPRLVKPPPAAFESRFKLLRLVHSELTRLNNELKKAADGGTSSPTKQRKAGKGSSVNGAGKKPGVQSDLKTADGEAQGGREKGQEAKRALSDQQLITLALDEEETVALSRPAIYTTAMRGVLMKYKRMTPPQWEEACAKEIEKTDPNCKTEDVSADQPKEISTGLTPPQEMYVLRRLLTPTKTLSQHGYVSSIPKDADIENARAAVEMAQNWEKCARCDRRFQVFPGRREEDGALTSGSECLHHPGKTYFQAKQPGDKTRQPKRYRCCGEAVGDSAGCATGDDHVFKVSDPKRLASVTNYAETPDNTKKIEYAVCFDCEMGYTVYGLELIRFTATSWPGGEELVDVLVRPKGEILDLNSRYSGVWPQDIANAEPYTPTETPKPPEEPKSKDPAQANERRKFKIVNTPEAARELLFSFITPDTPLVGHGLENDLNAMRIVHPTLVDTVLLYPHKLGLPYRHGLKMLAAQHLEKHIQLEDSSMQGHDSAEDARAAGELARLRVKGEWEAMKRRGWALMGDDFVPPPSEKV